MATNEKNIKIKQRADLQEQWKTLNAILLENELAFETDTGSYKIGNANQDVWEDLDYFSVGQFQTRTRNDSVIRGEKLNRIDTNHADGRYALAVNNKTKAYGDAAFASGYNTQAGIVDSETGLPPDTGYTDTPTAMGSGTKALGNYSMSVNYRSISKGDSSFAANCYTEANGSYSFACGRKSIATGTVAFASGEVTTASGAHSAAFGENTIVTGENAVVFGDNNTVNGENSLSIGYNNTINNKNSIGLGQYNTINGDNCLVGGEQNSCTNKNNIIFGIQNDIAGMNNNIIGNYNTLEKNAQNLLVFGEYNTIKAPKVIIGGYQNIANNNAIESICFGRNCSVNNYQTEATGINSHAYGTHSIAKGTECESHGTNSIVLGYQSVTEGDNSWIIGEKNIATGYGSSILGYSNTTVSPYSIAIGTGLITGYNNQIVLGKYNQQITDINSLLIIGNGSDAGNRKNALTLDNKGNLNITGNLSAANLINTQIRTNIIIEDLLNNFNENWDWSLEETYPASQYDIELELYLDSTEEENIDNLISIFNSISLRPYKLTNKISLLTPEILDSELIVPIPVILTIIRKEVNTWA